MQGHLRFCQQVALLSLVSPGKMLFLFLCYYRVPQTCLVTQTFLLSSLLQLFSLQYLFVHSDLYPLYTKDLKLLTTYSIQQ